LRLDALLFGESPSRVLISIKPEHVDQVMKTVQPTGEPIMALGQVTQGNLSVTVRNPHDQPVCQMKMPLSEMADLWHHSLEQQLKAEKS
jgi:phosphoribosylformylglycinamidine synthase